MRYRAISYVVGTFWVREKSTRPSFDQVLAKREFAIIKNELHCNAVRIFGQDIDRLITAATLALDEGLTVWLSPMLVDVTGRQAVECVSEVGSSHRAGTFQGADHVRFRYLGARRLEPLRSGRRQLLSRRR